MATRLPVPDSRSRGARAEDRTPRSWGRCWLAHQGRGGCKSFASQRPEEVVRRLGERLGELQLLEVINLSQPSDIRHLQRGDAGSKATEVLQTEWAKGHGRLEATTVTPSVPSSEATGLDSRPFGRKNKPNHYISKVTNVLGHLEI